MGLLGIYCSILFPLGLPKGNMTIKYNHAFTNNEFSVRYGFHEITANTVDNNSNLIDIMLV